MRYGLPLLLVWFACLPFLARAEEEGGADPFAETVGPFVGAHCAMCHAGWGAQGRFSIPVMGTQTTKEGASSWRRMRDQLAAGTMPPPSRPQPPRSEVEAVLALLDEALGTPATPRTRSRVTARRLNRTEYERTILDLLGVDFRADEFFPADDVGHGFDNVGDVLSLPPALLEKYWVAAEAIATQAVLDERHGDSQATRYAGQQLEVKGGGKLRGGTWNLFSTAEVGAAHRFPYDGRWRLTVRAFGQQAGPDPARAAFRLDGRTVGTADVVEVQRAPGEHSVEVTLAAGTHRVGVAFVNDYYQPKAKNPKRRDRNLVVLHLEVEGPLPPERLPPRQRDLVPLPIPGDDWRGPLGEALGRLARDVWRRPVTPEEVARLVETVAAATAEDERYEERVRVGISALLVSPHFLFRWELNAPGDGGVDRPLTDHELATRLAYFLWASTPDDRLLDLADEGRLGDDGVLHDEVERMLADARASSLATSFADQWLKLRALGEAQPDPERFPGVTNALLADMRQETTLLFDSILRERRDVRDLLTADYTFANERLAAHYGLLGVRGPRFRRVPLPPGGRRGVLGHASVLTATSNPARTSPVKRGKWVLETILDRPPPPPPPEAGTLDESRGPLAAASVRERLAEHRADPTCAACHDAMDPLGFALERYDAVGRYRTKDAGIPIDASGTLPDGRTLDGEAALVDLLAEDDAFLRSLAKHLLVYALGRGLDAADRPDLDRLADTLAIQPTLVRLVHEIVDLDAFRHRAAVAPRPQETR